MINPLDLVQSLLIVFLAFQSQWLFGRVKKLERDHVNLLACIDNLTSSGNDMLKGLKMLRKKFMGASDD